MDYKFIEGRLFLHRNAEEKKSLFQRLSRVEGQVRGVRQMIDEDRYCLDEVQQVNAITAAMREVALQIISDHLNAAVDFAVENHDGHLAVEEMMTVLRAALRQT
jgi:DNA-binding FrmR family transcriptional regulator